MQSYQKKHRISDETRRRLEEIVGASAVLTSEAKKFERYGKDQVADPKYAHMPDLVVLPRTTDEVAAVMKVANQERIPVTPRGAGSGLSGGAVPIEGGICLSLERMNSIIEIDTDNLVAVVEPGVITHEFDTALAPYGLFFAGYPMSEEFCSIGGNVAENAGGGRAIKYGVTGNYVLGLEVVTPQGEVFQVGGKRLKDVTGYDLRHLLVGSEGTLAIITKVIIRLMPRPTHRVSLVALYRSVSEAIAVIPAIMIKGRVTPTSVEFMDRICLHESCKMLKETLPYQQADAMLLLEADGNDEASVARDAVKLEQIAGEYNPVTVLRAETPEESERFWKIRKQVPWAIRNLSADQSLEDISVPVAAIPDMVEALYALGRKYDTPIPCFGHAADGNLHATPIRNPEHSAEHWQDMLPKLLAEIYRETAHRGGTISGEHGIGHKRNAYLPLVMEAAQIETMRRIKQALDPNDILNPGKILPVA